LFLILFLLMLLIVIPDRWHARREIAKRQREYGSAPDRDRLASRRGRVSGGRLRLP
jgi:hypothetical protein